MSWRTRAWTMTMMLPTLTFIVSVLIAFATGTSWGVSTRQCHNFAKGSITNEESRQWRSCSPWCWCRHTRHPMATQISSMGSLLQFLQVQLPETIALPSLTQQVRISLWYFYLLAVLLLNQQSFHSPLFHGVRVPTNESRKNSRSIRCDGNAVVNTGWHHPFRI